MVCLILLFYQIDFYCFKFCQFCHFSFNLIRYYCLQSLTNHTDTKVLNYHDLNGTGTHNYVVCKRTLNHLAKPTMIELCCKYFSLRCIRMYVLIMSRRPVWVKCCVFVYEIGGCGFESVEVTETSDIVSVLSKEFLELQAVIECGFTLKRVRDMIKTYS